MRRLISLLLFLAVAGPAAAAQITPASDLAATGEKAGSEGKLVVVFFYQEQCHYCEAVRKSFLRPIMNSDSYTSRITLRQVNTRGDKALTDFEGRRTTHSGFANRMDMGFTPTIAFYGPDGDRLTEPLVGLKGGRDYYGHYLDKAIDSAEKSLSAKR